MSSHRTVLISGASFAGLATAFWMHRLGWSVTVVDIASGIRLGGTPVNIRLGTVGILERMGLLEEVRARHLAMEVTELDAPDHVMQAFAGGDEGDAPAEEYEIERDALLQLMHGLVRDRVAFLIGDSITALEEGPDAIVATFRSGKREAFDLVLGCDGLHSNVRGLWFGPESDYARFLGAYGSIAILDRPMRQELTSAIRGDGRRLLAVNTYNGKTDIIMMFGSTDGRLSEVRDKDAQRALLVREFEGMGSDTAALLDEVAQAGHFYLGALMQVRMPAWSRGRVGLVGDAAYCPSPAAGMGGSLAIDGAMALAEAFEAHGTDHAAAFAAYETSLRPFVEKVQGNAAALCTAVTGGVVPA
jgi:2-polyprenyl-6-methoxyphenol hydroxylase-like FAD-dependent oxidoreductase